MNNYEKLLNAEDGNELYQFGIIYEKSYKKKPYCKGKGTKSFIKFVNTDKLFENVSISELKNLSGNNPYYRLELTERIEKIMKSQFNYLCNTYKKTLFSHFMKVYPNQYEELEKEFYFQLNRISYVINGIRFEGLSINDVIAYLEVKTEFHHQLNILEKCFPKLFKN